MMVVLRKEIPDIESSLDEYNWPLSMDIYDVKYYLKYRSVGRCNNVNIQAVNKFQAVSYSNPESVFIMALELFPLEIFFGSDVINDSEKLNKQLNYLLTPKSVRCIVDIAIDPTDYEPS